MLDESAKLLGECMLDAVSLLVRWLSWRQTSDHYVDLVLCQSGSHIVVIIKTC